MRIRIAALCLILIGLSGGAVAYGRIQPHNRSLYGLELCDGAPCFMGLNFRKIANGGVYAHIISLPGSHIITETNYRVDVPGSEFSYSVLFSGSMYDGLILIPQSKKLTLGDFISFYGQPCGMAASDPIPTTTLLYPSMTVTVEFENQFPYERLYYSTPVQQITLWNPDVEREYYAPCDAVRWKGFAGLRSYWNNGLVWSGD